jgi:hypothetical protein
MSPRPALWQLRGGCSDGARADEVGTIVDACNCTFSARIDALRNS